MTASQSAGAASSSNQRPQRSRVRCTEGHEHVSRWEQQLNYFLTVGGLQVWDVNQSSIPSMRAFYLKTLPLSHDFNTCKIYIIFVTYRIK